MTEGRRPACYIHVGPHKTGSSSIKHYALANLAALDELGLFHPRLKPDGARRGRSHDDLAYVDEIRPDGALKPGAELWPEIDAVARRGEKDILISEEHLCRALADRDVLDRVLTFFETRGYRVAILAYVRDQPAWLNSWYVQSQKRFAGLMTFDEFVAEADRRGRVEPAAYLAHFIAEPRCELEIVSFERAAAAGLEDDFIRRCGIDPKSPRLVRKPLRNPNAGAKSVFCAQEIMRRLGPGPRLKALDGFVPVCAGFKRRYVAYGWEATPFVALTEENVARIRARYAEGNEAFAQEFFGMSWGELCPAKPFETSVFDPTQASWWERMRIELLVRGTAAKLAGLRAAEAEAKRRRRAKAG
ncbi:hypothetical protein [Methylopila sp. M107]|uniref:hypothetical protein n=1 Tax=Methylopila sp. M107 TaxID=1101190 RepID=UPI000362A687|nr:hypothetical protein [Methylopila sp. M107]